MPNFDQYLPILQPMVMPDSVTPNEFHTWYGSYDRNYARDLTFSISTNATPAFTTIVLNILNEISLFANISFTRTPDQPELTNTTNYFDQPGQVADRNPDIRISMQSDTTRQGGLANFGYWWNNASRQVIDIDSYAQIWSVNYETILHEIGHTLGLKHTGPNQGPSVQPYLPADMQTHYHTVMHYQLDGNQNIFYASSGEWPYRHFQLLDVYAIQQRFGVNTSYNSGNTIYTAANFDLLWTQVLWDAGGSDTLDFSSVSRNQTISLVEGTFSSIGNTPAYAPGRGGAGDLPGGLNLSIAYGAIIENATGGSGNDIITGNGVRNILNGGAGADALYGGGGDDLLIIDNIGDIAEGGDGRDQVHAAVSHVLHATSEDIALSGSTNINATGNAYGNIMAGNAGNNVIDGGIGLDYMTGGDGDDIFIVDETDDKVDGEGGRDIVHAYASYALTGSTEDIRLMGSANISAVGNAYGNVMYGNAGNNSLEGGAGVDYMYGGGGDDIMHVDNADDVADGGDGRDLVFSSVSYTLGTSVEDGVLFGSTSINMLGNSGANTLYGSNGDNSLWGLDGNDRLNGRLGNDMLYGGVGADTFVFENGAGRDFITDFENGIDKIDLSSFGLTFADLTYRFQQSGNDAWFQLPTGEIIVLNNVQVGQLDVTDFIL